MSALPAMNVDIYHFEQSACLLCDRCILKGFMDANGSVPSHVQAARCRAGSGRLARGVAVPSDAVGVAGAAYITFNKITGRVDWACFSGPSEGAKPEYVRHYAALDPYSPLLDASWMKLSECLPDALLRRSEWYNDFVLACGVRDIVGTRLLETPSHRVIFGLHQQIGRALPHRAGSILNIATEPLRRAARSRTESLAIPSGGAFDAPRAGMVTGGSRFYFHICNGRR
ncbi:MAG: hypothetical protein ACXU9C_16075, partial [Xanthobacteraceae bacterium]